MSRYRILLVDDEELVRSLCLRALEDMPGVEVTACSDGQEALARAAREPFDLVLTDLCMPGVDGLAVLREVRRRHPELPVMVMTGFPSLDSAVGSLQGGAVDYLMKPILPEELRARIGRVMKLAILQGENRLLRRQLERVYRFGRLIGDSPAIVRVRETVERLAEQDVDLLIVGETGTGKELVARGIHEQSARRDQRFTPVDCGAIPENLMESEFFGYVPGAFTGATHRSPGLLPVTDGGTLFLDELLSMPLSLQVKLLRAVQERRVRPVGGTAEQPVNVRVIAALNQDPLGEMQAGRLREDLYYRLNVGRIDLPPLRARAGDVAVLTAHFMERFGAEMKRPGLTLDDEVLELFRRYSWPGNVRELQNVLKRMIVMSRDARLRREEVPDELIIDVQSRSDAPTDGFYAARTRELDAFERRYLREVLAAAGGDSAEAIRRADMPKTTFYRLLKKYDLHAHEFRPP